MVLVVRGDQEDQASPLVLGGLLNLVVPGDQVVLLFLVVLLDLGLLSLLWGLVIHERQVVLVGLWGQVVLGYLVDLVDPVCHHNHQALAYLAVPEAQVGQQGLVDLLDRVILVGPVALLALRVRANQPVRAVLEVQVDNMNLGQRNYRHMSNLCLIAGTTNFEFLYYYYYYYLF